MNRVLISLLKGTNEDKSKLLKENLTEEEILKLCFTGEIESRFHLEKGYYIDRFSDIKRCLAKGDINWVTIFDKGYPTLLKNIYDPPFLLYYRGELSALNSDLVSVVGTRKPSMRGLQEAFKLGLDLSRESVGVCSGLALGVDAAAQWGSVKLKGKTVAVLANGLDEIYPKSNRDLAGDIIKQGGVLISEFPPGEEPKRYNFPKRNRIIAGLAKELVIIQAPKGSGSLITGDFALESGRDVWVHGIGIGDNRFSGSDRYFKDGANRLDSALPLLTSRGRGESFVAGNLTEISKEDLLKMELEGRVIHYKGTYYQL